MIPRTTQLALALSLTLSIAALPHTAIADEAHASALDEVRIEREVAFRHLTVLTLRRDRPRRALAAANSTVVVSPRGPELSLGTLGPARPESLAVRNTSDRTIALVPGRYARGPEDDFVLTRHRVVRPDATLELAVTEASTEGGSTRPELLHAIAPPHLRFPAITRGGQAEVRETVQRWGRALDLDEDTGRISAVGLSEHELLRDHRDAYRERLERTLTAGPGAEVVGYVAFFGDDPAVLELYDSSDDLQRAWPSAAGALAVEASLIEATTGAVASAATEARWKLHEDRTRELLASLGQANVDREDRSRRHVSLRLTVPRGAAVALADEDDRHLHLLYLRDPAERSVAPLVDDFDPAEAARRARSTGEERRILERRGARTDGPRDIEGRSRAPNTDPGR